MFEICNARTVLCFFLISLFSWFSLAISSSCHLAYNPNESCCRCFCCCCFITTFITVEWTCRFKLPHSLLQMKSVFSRSESELSVLWAVSPPRPRKTSEPCLWIGDGYNDELLSKLDLELNQGEK